MWITRSVDAEENPELSSRYGIMQAPTLVRVKNGEIRKFVNASNIRRFTEDEKITFKRISPGWIFLPGCLWVQRAEYTK